MSRLATEFWVQAYLMRLGQQAIPAYIEKRGDRVAGAVLVKLCTLDGMAQIFQRRFDLLANATQWIVLDSGPEAEMDAILDRQVSVDPDLWVLAVEDRLGRHLLGDAGLD